MNIKIFSDGANLDDIKIANNSPNISGITTNPTLISKAGIKDYLNFCKSVLEEVKEKSVSLEIIADDHDEILRQSRLLSNLGNNVYVKIPIINSTGKSLSETIRILSNESIKINVTAVFTKEQITECINSLNNNISSYISIFAGRIADAGQDPEPFIEFCSQNKSEKHEIIWASPRESFNIIQAERSGAEIITATPELIKKMLLFGKNLFEYSVETSKMFYEDALKSKYTL